MQLITREKPELDLTCKTDVKLKLRPLSPLLTLLCLIGALTSVAQDSRSAASSTCSEWTLTADSLNALWVNGPPEILWRFEGKHRDLLNGSSLEAAEDFLRAVDSCATNDELKLWSSNLRFLGHPEQLSNEGFSRLVHRFAEIDDCSKYARIYHLYKTMSSEIVKRPNVFYADILKEMREQAVTEGCKEGEIFIRLTEVYRLSTLNRDEEACLKVSKINLPDDASPHIRENIVLAHIDANISGGNYYAAIDWLKRRLNWMVNKQDTVAIIRALNDIGVCFQRSEHPDSARVYYHKALREAQSIDHRVWQGILAGNLGTLLKDEGLFQEAIPSFRTDYEYTIDTHDFISGVYALVSLGECYRELGVTDSALYWLNLAENELDRPGGDLEAAARLRRDIFELRYKTYKDQGNIAEALSAIERHQQLNDSLRQLEYRRRTDNLTTVLSAERLESEKRALEDENRINKQLLRQERTNLIFVLIFMGVVLLILVALIRSNKAQKKARRETAELLDLTRQQNDRLNNFALIVSHNLRGSAGNIKSLVELLQNDQLADSKDELLQHLGLASDSLNQTINDLNGLTRSRSESHEMEPVKLFPIVTKVTADIKEAQQRQDFVVNIRIPQNLSVQGIPPYVESVVYNFISNAYKYRHPERTPRLDITAKKVGDEVVLSFEDNGLGIDLEKYGEELFKLFSTFHGNQEAQGVGLYATRNQVRSMGGSVDVDSTPGKGTRFTVVLQSVE